MNLKEWYTLDNVEQLSEKEKIHLTREYVNPGMVKLFGMLGFDKLWAISAQGVYMTLSDCRRILDMTGGSGVFGVGHNHPRILAARRRIAEESRLELCKSFLSPYVAVLAANLAFLLPGDLKYSFFCGGGADAVEGALKLAQKHHGVNRLGIVYTDRSFHGKTFGAMSVSNMDQSRRHFQLLDCCYKVSYGDAHALEDFFRSRCKGGGSKPDICAFILEAIHGGSIIIPPSGYLKQVREICTKYDVLLILDEIYLGLGRTGYWFAFESEDIVPDIVCYSKGLSGGKASIAGYTAREPVFLRAYGSVDDSMIQSSTFSGMTEECAAAIEALNVIRDERLVEKSKNLGVYLEKQLNLLQSKYPDRISSIRGRGLLWGVELKPALAQFGFLAERFLPRVPEMLAALSGAMVLSELFHSYGVLAYLGFTQRNLLVFSPPLIINESELDIAIIALDKLFSIGWVELSRRFVSRQIIKCK